MNQPSSFLAAGLRRLRRRLQKPLPDQGIHSVEIQGLVFHLDLAQHTHRRIAHRRDFEPQLTAALARCVQPGDLVVDIGANFGWHSLQLARRVPGLRAIHAFEPGAAAHGLFRRNLEANPREAGLIELRHLAIGKQKARLKLLQFEGLGTVNASIYPLGDLDYVEEEVPVEPLDALVAEMEAPPAVVKCDVEGAEKDVLEGCPKLLGGELGEPPMWFLEANYETSGMAGYFPWQLIDLAASYAPYRGYVLRHGAPVAMKSRTALRHGDTLVLAVEQAHAHRLRAGGP